MSYWTVYREHFDGATMDVAVVECDETTAEKLAADLTMQVDYENSWKYEVRKGRSSRSELMPIITRYSERADVDADGTVHDRESTSELFLPGLEGGYWYRDGKDREAVCVYDAVERGREVLVEGMDHTEVMSMFDRKVEVARKLAHRRVTPVTWSTSSNVFSASPFGKLSL